MFRRFSVCSLALAAIYASTVLASAQVKSSTTESSRSASSPVAYVYVSSSTNGTNGKIYGAAAAPNGSLSLLPGAPYPHNVNYMAVNGKWLFAIENNLNEGLIDSYAIEIGRASCRERV